MSEKHRFGLFIVAIVGVMFGGCVKVYPIEVGDHSGGKTTIYFKDNDHDELFLSTHGSHSDLWDTTANIAIFYKPIYLKTTDDTLHIMCRKPECFHPELTDACIIYHWKEENPLCYENRARADGYKIIHSLWTIDEYNQ